MVFVEISNFLSHGFFAIMKSEKIVFWYFG